MKPFFSKLNARVAVPVLLAILVSACGENPDAMVASAKDYLGKNDPKGAIIQLKNALQKNPESVEARFLLGSALLRIGDAAGAETELRKALALKQPAEQVVPLLAQAMLQQKQFKKLSDEFSQTNLSQPAAQAVLKTTLATAYTALGKPDLAQSALVTALAADPSYGPAKLLQARTKLMQKDIDGALAIAESVIAATPTNHEAWKLKGDVLTYGKTQATEGLAAYRKAVEVKPEYVDGHVAILTVVMRQGKLDETGKQLEALKKFAPGTFATAYFDTLVAYQRKNYKLAKERAQQMMKLAPASPLSLELAGAVELQNNGLLQAEGYLVKALQATPDAAMPRRLLATTYLRAGQPAKALATLAPALKEDKADPDANTLAGEIYLQNGDTRKAEEYFAKAAQQDPKNTKARTSLALTRLSSGREELAFSELQEIASGDSGITADMALISAHMNRQENDRALKAIELLEKKQPTSPLPPNLRGRTLQAKKDMAGARASFEKSLAIAPNYFPSISSLAAMDLAEKKPEDARKRFEALLAKEPKNTQAMLAIAELRARTGGSKDEVAELITRAVTANPAEQAQRLLLIDHYLRFKDFKPAVSAAQNALAALPDNPELMDALGRAQQASGDRNQALATYGKLALLQPLSPLAHTRMAEVYMSANNKDAAAQSLRKALDVKPDMLEAQTGLIALAIDAKNFPEASAIARAIQKQSPKAATGYVQEGNVAMAQKKWDVAADVYRAGLKQVPDPDLAMRLHSTLVAGEKPAEADRFAAGWLKDYPKDVVFRTYLGDAALARNDFAGAEKMYLGVVQIQPNRAVALNNLAWVTNKLKKEGAIAYSEKAIALAPNQPAYMDTLAMLLLEKKDHAKALEWQTKAISLQPQNPRFKFNLAKIHVQGGNKELARKELDELAKLGTKFGAHAEVATLLKTL